MTTTPHLGISWSTRRVLLASHLFSICSSLYLSHGLLPLYRPWLRAEPFARGPFSAHAWLLLIVIPLWYLILERMGLTRPTRLSWRVVAWRSVQAQVLGLAGLSVLVFVFKLETVSRLLIFGFCVLAAPLSVLSRWLALRLLEAHRSHIYNIARIVVIGTRERAKEFLRQARRAQDHSCHIAGCLDPEAIQAGGEIEGVPLLGSTEIFRDYLFSHAVDIVVFAMPLDRIPRVQSLIDAAMELGLRVVVLPDFYVPRFGYAWDQPEVSVEAFLGRSVAVLSNLPRRPDYLRSKRALDIVVSAGLLLLLAPLLFLLALLIKLAKPGAPVLYRWRVLGVNKKPFVSHKFRTMVPNAEQLKPHFLARNEMTGPVFKMRNDPRVTSLGRFLRKYSLDELPQLWSVLKGDMSLVGPRPPFPEEADQYSFWQRRKLSIKPGLTCLWQVNGRSEIANFDEWARMDLEYVRSASLWLDCKILLKTIPVVLRGRGAY